MDTLSMGIFNVIPGGVLRIYRRKPARTCCGIETGKIICESILADLISDTIEIHAAFIISKKILWLFPTYLLTYLFDIDSIIM